MIQLLWYGLTGLPQQASGKGTTMKWILILVGVLGLIGFIVWLNIQEANDKRKADEAMEEFKTQVAEVNRDLDKQILQQKLEYVRLTMGDVAASTYRLCHEFPPTQKENQIKCKKLDEQVAARQKKEKPW